MAAMLKKLNVLLFVVVISLFVSVQQVMWSAMMMRMQWGSSSRSSSNDEAQHRVDIGNNPWSAIDDDDNTVSSLLDTVNRPSIPNKMRIGHANNIKAKSKNNNYVMNNLRTALDTDTVTTISNHHIPDPTTPPTNIYILGERNSGTNYAASILKKAFVPPNDILTDPSRAHEAFSSDIPILRHKHMFRHSLLNETEIQEIAHRTDILWLLVVRRPCDWAEAMKRLPWHMCNPTNIASDCPGTKIVGFQHAKTLQRYTLAEFMQLEWGDWPESSNFRNLSLVSSKGGDFMYRNVFELRRHKLQLMKQIVDMVPRNVKIVRLHELELSPESMIQVSR